MTCTYSKSCDSHVGIFKFIRCHFDTFWDTVHRVVQYKQVLLVKRCQVFSQSNVVIRLGCYDLFSNNLLQIYCEVSR